MSTYLTYVRFTPRGTAFSDLQAVLQAWQPMQRVWSMTFPHCTDSVIEQNVSQADARPERSLANPGGAVCPNEVLRSRTAGQTQPGRTAFALQPHIDIEEWTAETLLLDPFHDHGDRLRVGSESE